jgi:hypothetical protein
MSTALRTIDCTPAPADAAVPAAPGYAPTDAAREILRLERQVAALQTDLTSARARNSTLMRELRRTLEAPAIVGQSTVNGMLTLVYSSGRILRCEPTCDETPDSITYGSQWVELTPAPDTPKAIVDAVVASLDAADDVDVDALPYIGGMEVVA